MYHVSTIFDILRQRVDSLAVHHFLVSFIFVRWGLVRDGPFESFSHYNGIIVIINDYFLEMGGVMSHCTTRSFEIIYDA